MPELVEVLNAGTGTEAAPASLSRLLIRHGQRFKKRCWPASKAVPMSLGSVTSGPDCACRATGLGRQ